MQGPLAARLPGGRLHLQHGPIDLILVADGDRERAFKAATDRFASVLEDLVSELPRLRRPVSDTPFRGSVAKRMEKAVRPHTQVFITPMAAVAGSVADEILGAMTGAADLTRASVNNGGDIALHLAPGETFTLAMASTSGCDLGRITIFARDGCGGIATSGRHGRSLSLGIADSVTVLARTAADADAAATLIANGVDLPDHPAITRRPARSLDPDSDLGDRLAATGCGALSESEIARALSAGQVVSKRMLDKGLILGGAIFLGGEVRTVGAAFAGTDLLPT